MDQQLIQQQFQEKVSKEVRLIPEGTNRYKVFTPFQFDDGDAFSIVLKKLPTNQFLLTDEGHTLMHISYKMDLEALESGTRQKILSSVLNGYSIEDRDGEFVSIVENTDFGNTLFSYIQGLVKISDIDYLSKERVKSTFWEDFKEFISSVVPEKRREFNYIIKEHDQAGRYPIDCRINSMKIPLFVFAIQNDDKCRDVTISVLQYEKWGIPFYPIAIFEDQEEINRKVLSRFSDVTEKQFSSLYSNQDRIESYLKKQIS